MRGFSCSDLRWTRPVSADRRQGRHRQFNIAKAYHPFVDGNKRAAAIAMLATCYLNGFVPVITQAELVAVIMLVVQGEVDREELAGFLRDHLT